MRELTDLINPEAVLLGEADVKAEKITQYFGDNSRMRMLFNFWTNQHPFLGLARKDAPAVAKGLELIKDKHGGHWVNFIRHHDELNISLAYEKEKQEIFDVFAPEENMRVFGNQGIRREILPMFRNDLKRVRLAYSLNFCFPGSILLSYGEELGMGDDLFKEERLSVRIPMQWNSTRNGGFSQGDDLYQEALDEGDYSYHKINADKQLADPESLLNWMKRMIEIRRQCTEVGTGKWKVSSDHFYTWSEDQGSCGFAWSWLGAALQVTKKRKFGIVNCPSYRYHPAVIAQAVATLLEMYPKRFWVAFGSGQALNEAIYGGKWPVKEERNKILKESVDIIKQLWNGEKVTHHGLVNIEEAKLYTFPNEKPGVIGAAITPETVE